MDKNKRLKRDVNKILTNKQYSWENNILPKNRIDSFAPKEVFLFRQAFPVAPSL